MSDHAGASVTCPKCSFEQPKSSECISCGIIFARWQANQSVGRVPVSAPGRWNEPTAPAPGPSSDEPARWGPPPGASAPRPTTPDAEATGTEERSFAWVRVGIGVVAIGAVIGLGMEVNPLNDPLSLVAVGIALCLAIWTGFSVRKPVVDGQLVLEALVAVVVVGIAILRYPGLGAEDASPASTADSNDVTESPSTKEETPLLRFASLLVEYVATVDELLTMNGEATHAEWDALNQRLDLGEVSQQHDALDDAERQRAQSTWDHVGALKTRLNALIKTWKKRSPNGYTFVPNDYERHRIERLFETAQTSVRNLETAAKALR